MTFFDIYREELRKSVMKKPENYALRPGESQLDYAERVADKMIAKMKADGNADKINTESPSFRRTCIRMGIGYNRKAITQEIQRERFVNSPESLASDVDW